MRNHCDRCGQKLETNNPWLMMAKPKTDEIGTTHRFDICEKCARAFFTWVGGGNR